MSVNVKQVIESTKELSSHEKALVAHCLISSLETIQEDGVDDAWGKLANKRYQELTTGAVKGVSWQSLKETIKNNE